MFKNRKKLIAILALVCVALTVSAESCGSQSKATEARNKERDVVSTALDNQLKSQPVPTRPWSQLRQNLIELETAQMDTTQTTTFFFNQGVTDPVMSCPSIGFPIAATSQLTNPEQKVVDHDLSLPQIDPNGVYAGDSTGTYVICIDATGKAYASYWEGFVQTVTGPARWTGHAVELTGPPSFNFSKGK